MSPQCPSTRGPCSPWSSPPRVFCLACSEPGIRICKKVKLVKYYLSVVDQKSIKMITERHRRVQGFLDGVPGTLIHWQRLEAVGINPWSGSHFLVFNKFLLDPGESELGITVVILKPVPAHHVQDVEDAVALAIDTIEYGVGVPPVLIPVPSGQVAGETFNLLPTFAKHLRGPISRNHEVSATLRG